MKYTLSAFGVALVLFLVILKPQTFLKTTVKDYEEVKTHNVEVIYKNGEKKFFKNVLDYETSAYNSNVKLIFENKELLITNADVTIETIRK